MSAAFLLNLDALPGSIVLQGRLSDDALEAMCAANDLVQFERTDRGEIVMNPPTAGGGSRGNAEINAQLHGWWKTHRRGWLFDSSGGFFLPDGSMLSPDAAYAAPETIEGIKKADLDRFLHIAPDFVAELISKSDRRPVTEAKMKSWISNGVKLGWMIDPYRRTTTVYRPGSSPVHRSGRSMSGVGPLEGFVFDMNEVWACYEV